MKRILIAAVLLAGAWFCWSVMRAGFGMIRKNSEGSSIGRLSAIRSTLSIYYGDMEGQYPADLSALTAAHRAADGGTKTYLRSLEAAQCRSSYHLTPDCSKNREPGIHDRVTYAQAPDDAGGWGYNNSTKDAGFGSIWINCTHTDARGRSYAAF